MTRTVEESKQTQQRRRRLASLFRRVAWPRAGAFCTTLKTQASRFTMRGAPGGLPGGRDGRIAFCRMARNICAVSTASRCPRKSGDRYSQPAFGTRGKKRIAALALRIQKRLRARRFWFTASQSPSNRCARSDRQPISLAGDDPRLLAVVRSRLIIRARFGIAGDRECRAWRFHAGPRD